MGRLRKVRTSNGELIAFRPARIAESIREAVLVCGMDDSVLADELAGVVTLFLEKHVVDARLLHRQVICPGVGIGSPLEAGP